ncbi:doubled CXXCH domain-containing protein [Mesobacillus persicus]|uniref:Doubled CXXCH domain-containing protein n=1 Tax=Mesobacillus persicus TaxID=930146 RepID=A0A1H8A339_9BACI|nr:cytochrome c3 family protein [Mesobacillus persicus]SEM65165.1 doubled CXXCH domain-containing protein [Mesobacillus persicus]
MSKLKIGLSAVFMLLLLGMFSTGAFAEGEFDPTSTNPAPGINVGTIDSEGQKNIHRTHGNFQNNTNSCANCHSTHQGDTSTLLKFENAEYDMCLSCHDGTMGFYNVLGEGAGAGTFNDTHQSSSMHNVKSGVAISAAPGATFEADAIELTCSSCHNPHGSVNDRLLREEVVTASMGKQGGLYAGLEKGTKAITLELTPDPDFEDLNAMTTTSGLQITTSVGPKGNTDKQNYAKFCSTCHDDYLAGSGNQSSFSGHYSHTTNSASAGRNCASCHYAHGTDITLLKDTLGHTVADKVAEGWDPAVAEEYMKDVSAAGSSLKKYTNMVVCWTCHQTSKAIDTQQPDSKYLAPIQGKYGIQDAFLGKPGIR